MRTAHYLPLAALAACTMATGSDSVAMTADAQARLDEALAGRTAEAPVACVQRRDLRGNRAIDERTILFEGTGNLVFVNRTRNACAGVRPWHALRMRTLGTSLCENDLVVAFDPTSGIEYGGCSLGEFTPYRRVG